MNDVQKMAEEFAICIHIDPEAIKGAIVIVTCMWMAVHNCIREEILKYACLQYPKELY